ncbi:hypothetical protein GCM10029963_42920 [Micromonospora andamanensis]
MAGRSPRGRNGETSPLRLVAIAAVLIGLVLVSLRLLPGSPFESTAAAQWGQGESPVARGGTSTDRGARPSPSPSPSPEPEPLPFEAKEIDLDIDGWYAWSVLDRRSGEIIGSDNMDETSTTASLIKAWIVADYLRRTADAGQTPSDAKLSDLTRIIRDSDNTRTEQLYTQIGRSASIKRLLSTCDLTDSKVSSDLGWSRTELSPGTPPASANASPTAPPPARSGPSGCSARCARSAVPATSASARRSRPPWRRRSPSITAGSIAPASRRSTSTAWRSATPGRWA